MNERRRSIRITAGHAEPALLPIAQSVQILDISVSGVLMYSAQPISLGTQGCLKLNFGGTPFSADVEVRRAVPVVELGVNPGYRVGGMFVGITPEHRQLIERFASQ